MQIVNIILQLTTLGLIFIGWRLKKKGKFTWHGNFMLVAVFIVALMILSHMGPALISIEEDIAVNILNATPIIGLLHAVLGSVAIVLGAWLVANWAYIQASPSRYCAARKRTMKKILILWLAALSLGMIYYIFHSIFPA